MPHGQLPPTRLPRPLTRAAAVAAVALLALAVPASAHAQTAPEPGGSVPADLAVALSGPGTGTAGGTGDWAITVSNTGGHAATAVRVTMVLPDGVSVTSVTPTDDWACVLGGGMSCQLEGGLAPGASADPIPVVLSYAATASGSKALAADAYQGEGPGEAMTIHRGAATVVLSPAPAAPAAPPKEPATTSRTTAPAPVASSAAPVAVAPVETPAATAVATTSATPLAADQPEVLAFTDAGATAPAPEDGGVPLLLLMSAGTVLVAGAVVAVWTIRRRATTA